MPQFTCLHRKNRKQFRQLPALYAAYRQQTILNHGGKKHRLSVFRRELQRVLRKTDECVWSGNPRCFVVLHEGDTVLGFADIRTVSTDIPDVQFAYGTVEDFFVVEQERKKGYGRLLYERVERVFRENNTKTVLLTPDPVSGVQFWEKMGYESMHFCIPDTESTFYKKEI
ncbi:MAG: GNAT family N-acetyltransferase [Clostridia bacterium]|nr:GNAT family N-acetyltransferase [Clostridia bacterium]